ncbi:MAG: arsenite methyltransferase [bacterium]|nr:arsenite methyltransferase [bacterium]
MISEKSASEVREEVSRAYTQAVEKVPEGRSSCCAPSSCCTTIPAGVAAQQAGYGEELTEVPSSAASSSFGCGNPLAFAGVRPGDTVLDLGSGAGLDLLIAARKVGEDGKVIGIDMTDAMIETANRNIEQAGVTNVEVRKGLIEDLPVEDASVDWVISNCVINLSPEKEQVFREISRVLKPGGRISISDIVAEKLPDWLREQAAAYSACIGGAISEDAYRAGLEEAGLTEVEVDERVVYDAAQLRGIVASDLEALGATTEILDAGIEQAAGKVWSAKFTGRKT